VDTVTGTCVYHQPLDGVCAYTDRVCVPAASGDTTAEKPDEAQKPLSSAWATSGRGSPIEARPRNVPPAPDRPSYTWTSSTPAQPWAVWSTNQPETTSG
jgi:hypothetical protein